MSTGRRSEGGWKLPVDDQETFGDGKVRVRHLHTPRRVPFTVRVCPGVLETRGRGPMTYEVLRNVRRIPTSVVVN